MSAIRRANPISVSWREVLEGVSSDSITETEVSLVDEEVYTDNTYPYADQDIIRVEFTYPFESFGEPSGVRMVFYYRTESGIFILHPGTRDDLVPQVVRELKSILSNNFKILPGMSVSLEGIWNFIEAGEWLELTVEHDFKQYDLYNKSDLVELEDEIDEEIIRNLPIKRAKLLFSHGDKSINTIYSSDSITIPTESQVGVPDLSAAPTIGSDASYILQTFETEAIYNG